MIQVGVIGLGFMGGVHLRHWQALEGARVVAVCDTTPVKGRARQGNLDVAGEELDLGGVAIYTETAEMLAGESLDAVSIALPTHLHKAVSIQCLEAGVHVLCEKPMALNLDDCDAMIAAAKTAGRHLMIAHCIRFWPEYSWARQMVESGTYGKLRIAHFSRLTCAPGWDAENWFSDPNKSGGIALDLHIHDLDYIQWLLGSPEKIESDVTTLENGIPGHVLTQLSYDNKSIVSATASWMMPPSFGFRMAFSLVFEKVALIFDGRVLTVCPDEGTPYSPELPDGDGYRGEITYFSDLISGRSVDESAITLEQSRESVRMALETMKP